MLIKRGIRSFLLIISITIGLPLSACYASAFPEEEKKQTVFDTFTLYWENDLFAGTDSNYTNGLLLSWSTPYQANDRENGHMPDWTYPVLNRLPLVNNPEALRAVSLSIGQLMFTPEDIHTSERIADDRPYAGYLYLGLGFNSILGNRLDTWQINAGVVGPASLAQEAQDLAHKVTDTPLAKGWDNQLENEPALEAIWESKWRVLSAMNANGFGYDFIPHLGARMGNVAIYANGGAELRVGWFVPDDFGSCGIRPGCETNPAFTIDPTGDFRRTGYSIHFFTTVDARLVLRDIFLDGNTFKDSHRVDKEYGVADLMTGLAVYYGRFRVSYAYTFRTREFKAQEDPSPFGSLSISFSY